MANTSIKRCAIYTRKSSEEGLEQDYNSLHAQREACEAFIRSQAGEGWRLVKTAYDDGGFSGGTMERPALQQLLQDIREGKIDVVVVYKVDRLTRSLADFARMVELFDAHERVVRGGDPAIQHHDLDGSADAQRAAVVRSVRARSDRRANSRQGGRLQAQGNLDGRNPPDGIRRARAQAGDQQSVRRKRCVIVYRAISEARQRAPAEEGTRSPRNGFGGESVEEGKRPGRQAILARSALQLALQPHLRW